MRLNAKILKNVASVNQWEYAENAYIQEGQINSLYLQLVDLDMTPVEGDDGSLPSHPMRFLPQGTTTLAITFPALRSELDDPGIEEFTVSATQPFSDDSSIWKVTLTSSQLPKSGNIKGKLTVDGVDTYFIVISAVQVNLLNVGGC